MPAFDKAVDYVLYANRREFLNALQIFYHLALNGRVISRRQTVPRPRKSIVHSHVPIPQILGFLCGRPPLGRSIIAWPPSK